VCTPTFFRMPAFLTYFATVYFTDETLRDVPFFARKNMSSSKTSWLARHGVIFVSVLYSPFREATPITPLLMAIS
jgi:hypothetical protein